MLHRANMGLVSPCFAMVFIGEPGTFDLLINGAKWYTESMKNAAPLTTSELHVLMHLLQSWRTFGAQKEAPQVHWPRSLEFVEVADEMQSHFESLHAIPVAGGTSAMELQAADYLLHRLETLRDGAILA